MGEVYIDNFNMFDSAQLILIIFFIILGIILFRVVGYIKQEKYNDKQSILTVETKVVTKRQNVSTHLNNQHVSSNTTYYATFEMQNGDRIEFHVSDKEYGLLAEGDQGKLTYQGTHYLSFERFSLS